ncbi:MAG: PAS domain S-box [Methanomicrobiales archaeon 53_19]|jgi:PAS domain S-box-containing protein|uniref:response regulator n=1 Tax=Methanocalculus sp. TaxID=2004547 RepID=UPI000748D92A|nr:response regulator [Methanocalculus sp.]KUK71023.1 MAG: PAS domain S-box [Methanocalculus sp. 52_23]KUL02803.1 MAG: PAS domain S-box [Methanomicrobiales archaeon 53_19]HIJ06619.1 response regulator [Methanocalculus sp.]
MSEASIMIVEDEAVTAMALKRTLTNMGYSVCGVFPTGEQAVQKAAELKPDLILMDIKLAGKMTGINAATEIRATSTVPVIYLTAFSDDRVVNAAKVTGPFGYILKPVREQELKTTIETALYKHAMDLHLREYQETVRVLLNATPDMHFLIDSENTIRMANQALAKRAGKTVKELVGSNVYDLVSSGCLSPRMAGHAVKPGQSRGETFVEQFSEHWYDVGIYPIANPDGKITKYAVHIHDITRIKMMEDQLRQNEEFFNSIIDDVADVIIILNDDGTLRQESPSLNRYLGYSEENNPGKKLYNYIHDDSLEDARKLLVDIGKNPLGVQPFDLTFRSADGRPVSIRGILSDHSDDPDYLFDGLVLTGWVKKELK